MSVQAFLNSRYQNSSIVLQAQAEFDVDGESVTSQIVPAGATVTIPVQLDPLYVKYIYMQVSVDGVHFQPENPTTGNPAFSLFADTPLYWTIRMPQHYDHGFSEPVLSFVVHNPDSDHDAQVDIRIGYDNPN